MRERLAGDYAGDEYIFRTYEGDYDRNGTKEAFVVCGKKRELTKESFFGSLFFVNDDLEAQCLALAVFMDKEPKFQYMDGQILVQLDYVEGIYPEADVYEVKNGEAELAIITYTMHGTGVSVETLYMVDRDENGEWKMYHLPSALYCETLHEHFDTVSVEGGVRFCLDGQLIGPVDTTGEEYETEDYEYDVGDQVDFSYGHDAIKIEVEVEGIPIGGMLAIHAYPGHILSAGVEYLGSGKWQLADICYRNERIESVIEVVMRYYFEGNYFLDPEEIYSYLDKDCEIGAFERNGAEIDSLAFTYSADEIASGIVNVKLLVYLEGEDEPHSFTVTVVRSEGNVWWNEWKVTEFIEKYKKRGIDT